MKIDIDQLDYDICFCGSNLKYAACCKIDEGKLELICLINKKIDITKCTKTDSVNNHGNPIIVFHYNNEDVYVLRNPKFQRQRLNEIQRNYYLEQLYEEMMKNNR
jgi:hypothetical protein